MKKKYEQEEVRYHGKVIGVTEGCGWFDALTTWLVILAGFGVMTVVGYGGYYMLSQQNTPEIIPLVSAGIGTIGMVLFVVSLWHTIVHLLSGTYHSVLETVHELNEELMTPAECFRAMNATMISVPEYSEICYAAKNGNLELKMDKQCDDIFLQELGQKILSTTGAKMDLEEIREYFSQWYLSQKE